MYLICFCLILFKVVEIIILHNKKRPKHPQITDLSFAKGEITWGNINQATVTATPGCLLKWNPVSHFYIYIYIYNTSNSVQNKIFSSKNTYMRISVFWNSGNACKTPGRVWEKENTTMHFVRCGLGCGFFVSHFRHYFSIYLKHFTS